MPQYLGKKYAYSMKGNKKKAKSYKRLAMPKKLGMPKKLKLFG
jgi:hypothetical protein